MSTRYHSAIIKAHHLPQTYQRGKPTAGPLSGPTLVGATTLASSRDEATVDDLLAEADALVEEAERLAAVQMTRTRLDSIDRLCAQVDSLFDD